MVNNVKDIKHRIIRQVFKDYKISGVDFNSSADIPSGTGLGSSSAFTAGLITLCNAATNKYMSKEDIAKYACDIEIDKLGEPIGKQDQYACSVGGLNFFTFNKNGSVSLEKVLMKDIKLKQLEENLMLFYLGSTRSASSILTEQREVTVNCKKRINNLRTMVALSKELKSELQRSNIDAMGDILHRGWMYKKELTSKISNQTIDHYYSLALQIWCTGWKAFRCRRRWLFTLFCPKKQTEKC